MTAGKRQIIAEAYRVSNCPLYRGSEAFIFNPPTVRVEGSVPICAIAVQKLQPVVRKILSGKAPESFSGKSCGGCLGGEAWFRFRFRPHANVPDGSPISQRTLEALACSQLFAQSDIPKVFATAHLYEEVSIPAGRVLISSGTESPGIFIVIEGRFEVVWHGDESLEVVVDEIGPGECIGEISALTRTSATTTFRAATDATLVQIRRDSIDALFRFIPQLPMMLMRVVAGRVVHTTRRLRSQFDNGWRGRLDSVNPAELIQSLVTRNQSGILRARHGDQRFLMRLHAGRAGEMSLGEFMGDDAFNHFLDWDAGTFEFKEEEIGSMPAQTFDLMHLLLEAMRQRDERQARTRAG